MQINVSQLLKESIGSSRAVEINEPAIGKDMDYIKGRLSLIKTECGILVKGQLTAKLFATCSRCLRPFDNSLDFGFAEEFFRSWDISSGSSLDNSSECFTIDRNHNIDINGVIVQYISLAKPVKSICRSDCPGICPSCGQNLNEGKCMCNIESLGQYKIKSVN